jgi:coenzyme F420-reducing hydrogenase beta subunit
MELRQTTIKDVASDKCYGCGICAVACTQNAVNMEIDEDGFLNPVVSTERCNECSACIKVCPSIKKTSLCDLQESKPMALRAKNSKIRYMTTSGGAALMFALSSHDKGRFSIGAVFNDDFRFVKHVVAKSSEEVIATVGSKYIQSEMSAAITEALQNKQHKYIVFGTPCQIAGVRNIVEAKGLSDNYILVDIFCHGVPTHLLWRAYVDELSVEVGEIKHIDMRSKVHGWHAFSVSCVGANGAMSTSFTGTSFYNIFLSDSCLRDSCYTCSFGRYSSADLRLGDFWGKEFTDDFLGTSICVPLTDSGMMLVESTANLDFRSVAQRWLQESQPRVNGHVIPKPDKRSAVIAMLRDGKSLDQTVKQLRINSFGSSLFKDVVRKVLKPILPKRLKGLLKTLRAYYSYYRSMS